jgi:OFA family oxalate/formate antiporter-like MFS transporter
VKNHHAPTIRSDAHALIRQGWIVTWVGVCINLAIGGLYSWSVISKRITQEYGWSETAAALPYSVAIAAFSFMMVPAGRLQDKLGPRLAVLIGGILYGGGFIVAGLGKSVTIVTIGFGLMLGSGIGFAYAATLPPALKWFPPERTGFIAGMVVAGIALASVYIAPTANFLLNEYGIRTTFQIFGLFFAVVVITGSRFLKNPPVGYVPQKSDREQKSIQPATQEMNWRGMLRTRQFYLCWLIYTIGAGAGLMIISKLALIVDLQAGIKAGFIFVVALAIGNASGRFGAGAISDRLGRIRTLQIVYIAQALLLLVMIVADSYTMLLLLSALIGINFGANLSLFPVITKDYFGLKDLGVNYGLIFTAYGTGGVVGPILGGMVFDATGSFVSVYIISVVALLVATGLTLLLKVPTVR